MTEVFYMTNEQVADLAAWEIRSVEMGDDVTHDQREITLNLMEVGGFQKMALTIRAFTNNGYHEPARLMFESQVSQ